MKINIHLLTKYYIKSRINDKIVVKKGDNYMGSILGLDYSNRLCKYRFGTNGNVYIDASYNRDFHVVIPLIKTCFNYSLEAQLVFSSSNLDNDTGFGKGMFLSFYKKLVYAGGDYILYEADGSATRLSLNTYNKHKNIAYDSK